MDPVLELINNGALVLEQAKQQDRKAMIEEKIAANGGLPTLANFPPNMIGQCSRKCVYHMLRLPVEKVFDPRLLRIFDNGDDVHERLTKYLAASGGLWRYEMVVHDENLRIKGRLDNILKLDEDKYDLLDADKNIPGRPYLIGEIKSANNDTCRWMERDGEPNKKYVLQIMLYMHITGIHKGVIIVERKDDQVILGPYYVDYDPVIAKEALDKVATCIGHVDCHTLPPREGTRKSSTCWNYKAKQPCCDYYDICWSETEGMDLVAAAKEAYEELIATRKDEE
jgi:hypothetical protein